ncbi:MAG: DUF2130 domain-containing protein [Firmicutes bacterium]|nr:DUF2130 domain-containing protein [Bacillota bacterium]
MNEIKCPSCNKVFKADEAGFADIVKQVRDETFAQALSEKEKLWDAVKKTAVLDAQTQLKDKMQASLTEKDALISQLNAVIAKTVSEKELAVEKATAHIKEQVGALKVELETTKTDKERGERVLKEQHAYELSLKDKAIDLYKDMKLQQTTKLVGESLEQHCEIEFNKIRSAAFPSAQFGKDNDAKSGSKGDYIYRELNDDGVEIISIMFEMKNQEEQSAFKKKNDDFLDKLHKDRTEKNCEYAVLVSLLEPQNDFYNAGIADVSFRYPKMYVVRPQCFIPMITLLRNAALNTVQHKAELALFRNQNIDIANFENSMNKFKEDFSYNYSLASRKFNTAIEEINTTIKHLEKVRDALQSSDKNLRIANEKAEKLTIKRLTKGNPTMTEMFAQLPKKDAQDEEDETA